MTNYTVRRGTSSEHPSYRIKVLGQRTRPTIPPYDPNASDADQAARIALIATDRGDPELAIEFRNGENSIIQRAAIAKLVQTYVKDHPNDTPKTPRIYTTVLGARSVD